MARAERIERVTLPLQIAERLRTDILAGTYPGGAQLPEMELAITFGVSRGPLREALQRLVQEGLLRSEPHRGVFVTEVGEEDLKDLFFVRETLETAALRKIFEAGTQNKVSRDLIRIAERMDRAMKAGDKISGGDLDFEFHRVLVDAAQSKRLSRTYASVQTETRLCLHRLMGGYRSSRDLAAEHFRLAELIETADLPDTLKELKNHLGDPARHLKNTPT
ncbi:GntR family transcriptional regulator [Nisaea acidiphila]|uniref:GntR family transcriptional regulator n=1 Tax=Nisaea acidiphila TaxID=1862145 RepID=A0A9J7AUC4_9PROT|nr:GntR family transcriptional regulator [Nisaea acidiphila]UUX50710.1 GntR family transcriptional regulator [Nisaea acidiphila]